MFGQSSQAASSSGLFSHVPPNPSNDQPAKRRSIFDTTSAITPQSSAASGTGLFAGFGSTPAQPAAPTSSLLGASSSAAPTGGSVGQNTSQPAPADSFFAASQGLNRPLNQGQTTQNQSQSGPNSLSQSTREPAYFNSLLERGRKRAHPSDSVQNESQLRQIPGLHLGLDDLTRRAQGIGARGGRATPVNGADSRAHYLLAASGVSPGEALKDFESVERDAAVEKSADTFDPDNEKYLRGLQQRGRDAMIKESMERVQREFDAYLEEHLAINFDEQRQRIMEHFGLATKESPPEAGSGAANGGFGRSSKGRNAFSESAAGSTRSVFGKSGMERSIIGNAGLDASTTKFFADDTNLNGSLSPTYSMDRSLWNKEGYYADKVMSLNAARLKDEYYPVLGEFALVEDNAGGDSPRQLGQAYQALIEVVKENSEPKPKERQYSSAYLDEQPNSPKAVKLRKQVLDGARTFLEKSFYRELEALIEKNPREAQLGGRPTTLNKIRAYIRVRSARKDLAPDGTELQRLGDEGEYCWILIFFLLRCGFVKDAAEYVNGNDAFQSTDRRFVAYLSAYASSPDRRLNRKLQEMINGEYQQRVRVAPENSVDPYRMACYGIVGRCDLRNRRIEGISQSVEDWIWLQFNLARELDRNEEVAGDIFGLEQICETVREIGQRHFQKGLEGTGGFATYFLIQILAGMYEHAVQYLHSYAPASAVHFAIALDYYGLLRVSDFAVAGNELRKYNTLVSIRSSLTRYSHNYHEGTSTNQFRPLGCLLHVSMENCKFCRSCRLPCVTLPEL